MKKFSRTQSIIAALLAVVSTPLFCSNAIALPAREMQKAPSQAVQTDPPQAGATVLLAQAESKLRLRKVKRI